MIFTLGHSTHEPDRFVDILDQVGLDGIVDVRSHPTSKWEWWRKDNAKRWLSHADKSYRWMPALGGWDVRHANLIDWAEPRGVDLRPYIKGHFPKQRIAAHKLGDGSVMLGQDPDFVSLWTSQGLHDYAWFEATGEFLRGLRTLAQDYGREDQPNVAIVCSELLWWKCHRSMIADALGFFGVESFHVMPTTRSSKVSLHDPTPRLGRYPKGVLDAWKEIGALT